MEKEMFEKGLKIRREVLGAEYVDKAISTADDFNRPLQELVTTYAGANAGAARPGSQDAQHAEPGDDLRPEPAA